jgi:predicted acylesterase/phospholipase RssA
VKESVDYVLSGGGTLAAVHVGALAALLERKRVAAIGGTSAGSIVAAGYAVGMDTESMLNVFKDTFKSNVLDRSWYPLNRWGLYKGDVIHQKLREVMPGTMGSLDVDCRIVVCDLWTRRPVVVTRKTHPKVLVADAVRCSLAIPGFFRAARLEADNARLYVDGGVSMNFAHAVFDDLPERTIGARFLQQRKDEVRPVRNTVDYVKAMASLLMYSSDEAHISSKRYADVVTLQTSGNGMDFTLTDRQIDQLYDDGFRSMDAWLDADAVKT